MSEVVREHPVVRVRRAKGIWQVVVRPAPALIGEVDQYMLTADEADAYADALADRFGWIRAHGTLAPVAQHG